MIEKHEVIRILSCLGALKCAALTDDGHLIASCKVTLRGSIKEIEDVVKGLEKTEVENES